MAGPTTKRFGYISGLNNVISKLNSKLLTKHDIFKSRIFTDWALIIGQEFAGKVTPISIQYHNLGKTQEKILVVEVDSSAVATKLSYITPMIVEKIAIYLGYRAIDKIKIIQRPQNMSEVMSSVPQDISNVTINEDIVAGIDDIALAEKLVILYKRVLVTQPKQEK